MEENNIIVELKERALERVKDHQEQIRQNEMFIKCCDDTSKSIADPAIFKKIKYNAINAKNAAENPDIAPADDKERAEVAIKDATIKLMASKNGLEEVLTNLNDINVNNLESEVNDLRSYVSDNKELDEKWFNYSKDVLTGKYYEFNEKEVVEYHKQEEVIEEPEHEYTLEEETIDEPVVEEQKVVSSEPYVEKEDSKIDKLYQELDAELDQTIKNVQEDITNLKDNTEPVLPPTEPEPTIESPSVFESTPTMELQQEPVTDFSNAEPADFFSINTENEVKEEETDK